MKSLSQHNTQRIYLTLRIAVAMCFIGHGAFGIITKPIWCNYFAVFGIGKELAFQLMPPLGVLDVLLGLAMLVYPVRFIPAWLVFWGLVTAFLRPISGEPFAEFIERAGNYGAPFALLLMVGIPRQFPGWFKKIKPAKELSDRNANQLFICLRIACFLLLQGHGWLNLILKKGLITQYASLGFPDPTLIAHLVGAMELILAFVILFKPFRELVLLVFIWKMLSETLYANYPLFEWIERGGSYGCLLALYFLTDLSLLSSSRVLNRFAGSTDSSQLREANP